MVKSVTAVAAALGVLLLADLPDARGPLARAAPPALRPAPSAAPVDISADVLTGVVQRYCQVCHNDQLLTGNLSLQGFDVAAASDKAEIAERMIRKLRAGMMPPPGAPRPSADTLLA